MEERAGDREGGHRSDQTREEGRRVGYRSQLRVRWRRLFGNGGGYWGDSETLRVRHRSSVRETFSVLRSGPGPESQYPCVSHSFVGLTEENFRGGEEVGCS